MPADLFDPEPLLSALDDAAPCGANLEHDADFQALEQAGAGKPERQYGDKTFPAEPPDWLSVHERALALAKRTRDLRVAVWLTRAGAVLHGLAGAAPGLEVVRGLLERHWEHVHPQLDASDKNDPTARLSALAPLYATSAALADLRAATVAPVRNSLTLRELELGLGRDKPQEQERLPTEAGVLQALRDLLGKHAGLADTLTAAAGAARGIADAVTAALGSRASDAAPLVNLLGTLDYALGRLPGGNSSGPEADNKAGDGTPNGARAGVMGEGAIQTRTDATRELERIAVWIEQREPSNPAPLLIRRAMRLMSMTFIEIVRDIASNGLDQVVTIAGPPAQS